MFNKLVLVFFAARKVTCVNVNKTYTYNVENRCNIFCESKIIFSYRTTFIYRFFAVQQGSIDFYVCELDIQ